MSSVFRTLGFILILIAVIAGLYWFAQRRGVVEYSILFDNGKGVLPHDPVRLEGADIGRVEEVEVTDDRRTRVMVSIERRYRPMVHAKSTAIIEEGGPGGRGRFVEIFNIDAASLPISPGAEVDGADSRVDLQMKLTGGKANQWVEALSKQLDDISARLDELKESEELRQLREEVDELTEQMAQWAAGKYEEFRDQWPAIRERLEQHYEKAREIGDESLSKAIEDMLLLFGAPTPTPER